MDTRPLRAAGKFMRPWIKEHGDDYYVYEKTREVDRVSLVQRPGDKVKYIDEDEEGFESRKSEDRHAG